MDTPANAPQPENTPTPPPAATSTPTAGAAGTPPSPSRPASGPALEPVTIVPEGAASTMRVELVQGTWWGRFGTRIAWVIAGFCLLSMLGVFWQYQRYLNPNPQITEHFFEIDPALRASQLLATDKIAIITIEGTILQTDGFARWQIDQVRNDPAVKAIVLRIDSPGGTVNASHYLWHRVNQLKEQRNLPVVVSMGGMCASGGYYIAMAANPPSKEVIYAEPTTWTGSIGVMIPHYDVSRLLDDWRIKDDSIVSHPLKNAGSMTKEFTPEERKIFQELVNSSFQDFKDIVKGGRPKFMTDEEALNAVATGQVFTAKQALANGLVDKLGYLEDAVKQAAALANLTDPKQYRAVRYTAPRGLFDDMFGGLLGQSGNGPAPGHFTGDMGTTMTSSGSQTGATASLAIQTAAEILQPGPPRAYYLCTGWPGLGGW
ncbi:MAG: signal peptide peptidase SppA [Pirellulales bacterium]|nr:signal peptide peptidase SppA [Pirellulales bacterium]